MHIRQATPESIIQSARRTLALQATGLSMLDDARLKVLTAHQGSSAADRLRALELEGIKTSLKNLRTFPCIQSLESKGRVTLHGAYFEIATGTLAILNQLTGNFYDL